MIYSNLSKIIRDRGYNISKVSQLTGISRTTLTSLYHNTGNGIQFETLDKLCAILRVSPNDLFIFVPYDITVYATFSLPDIKTVFTECVSCSLQLTPILPNSPHPHRKIEMEIALDVVIERYEYDISASVYISEDEEYFFQRVIDNLSDNVLAIIQEEISDAIYQEISDNVSTDESEQLNITIDLDSLNKWDKFDVYNKAMKAIGDLRDREK